MRITLGNIVTVATVFETEVPDTNPVQYEPADPTTVNLITEDPAGVEHTYVYGTDLEVTRTAVGAYTADLLPEVLGLWRGRWEGEGAAVGAGEFSFTVFSLLDENAFPAFLELPDDYDGIRGLLGVEKSMVTDDELSMSVFAPQAEMRVKSRVPTWLTLLDDSMQSYVLRLAAIYATAALFAESRALGGVIGLSGDVGVSLRKDWPKLAEALWQRHTEWVQQSAIQAAVDAAVAAGGTADTAVATTSAHYDFQLVRMSGPSRARYVAQGVAAPYWWRYPPVVGVPPDWPAQIWQWGPWTDPFGGTG